VIFEKRARREFFFTLSQFRQEALWTLSRSVNTGRHPRSCEFAKILSGGITMKSLAGFIVTLLTVAVLLGAAAMAQSATEKEIVDLEQKMNAAYAANDLPTYFACYSPDFTQWLPEGRTDLPQYEKMWTAFIKSGGGVESDQISDMHVQLDPSGDTAVASYLLRVKTRSAKGEVTDEQFQETDVWFKRNGVWKVVHLHYSPAPKKK
jgi:ketosteroid isomerase-like protein